MKPVSPSPAAKDRPRSRMLPTAASVQCLTRRRQCPTPTASRAAWYRRQRTIPKTITYGPDCRCASLPLATEGDRRDIFIELQESGASMRISEGHVSVLTLPRQWAAGDAANLPAGVLCAPHCRAKKWPATFHRSGAGCCPWPPHAAAPPPCCLSSRHAPASSARLQCDCGRAAHRQLRRHRLMKTYFHDSNSLG